MTTTEAFDLARRSARRLERQNRHLSDSPAEGNAIPGKEELPLDPRRLRRAKTSYNARHLHRQIRANGGEGYHLLRGADVEPKAGDFVLARVVTIGQHKRLESYNSRRRHLFMDDEIIVAYGDRSAPDQFLAEVPRNLNYTNLVAAGGVAGRVIDKHASIEPATVIEPIGLICDKDGVVSMKSVSPAKVRPWRQALEEFEAAKNRPRVILVFGSSMNSGKSTVMGAWLTDSPGQGKS